MTLRITDDLIKDVMNVLGPSTASQIYREIINRDSTLPIEKVRQRAGAHIRSMLKYHIIAMTNIYDMDVFHFPGVVPELSESEVMPNNVHNNIVRYLESLPPGTEVCYKELTDKFHVHRDTVYLAVKKSGLKIKYAPNRRVTFVKEEA